jgi:hypothetical protein
MNNDLLKALPILLPSAIAWAEGIANEVAQSGSPLTEDGLALARSVGVKYPERIRIAAVSSLPLPEDPDLRAAALQTGLLATNMVGLTLGYSVFICHGYMSTRLLSHEFRHVYQYELFGSIAKYLPAYLQQIVDVGYANAPFEIDARDHETNRTPPSPST